MFGISLLLFIRLLICFYAFNKLDIQAFFISNSCYCLLMFLHNIRNNFLTNIKYIFTFGFVDMAILRA
jgi:hypothetical protein